MEAVTDSRIIFRGESMEDCNGATLISIIKELFKKYQIVEYVEISETNEKTMPEGKVIYKGSSPAVLALIKNPGNEMIQLMVNCAVDDARKSGISVDEQ